MVQAIVNISKRANKVLNIVKAKYDLKDKSQAIEQMAKEYEQEVLEPQLRPEYVNKINAMETKGKFVKFKTIKELRKEIENA